LEKHDARAGVRLLDRWLFVAGIGPSEDQFPWALARHFPETSRGRLSGAPADIVTG
jgi:hypothetical protein